MALQARPATGLDFRCPECGEALLSHAEELICPSCEGVRPVREGIASFCQEEVYGGEDPGPCVEAVLEEIREHGWEEAIHRRLVRARRDLYWDIFEPLRADWFYLGEVERRGRALDLSADWGGLSLRLGRLFEEVVSVDGVWSRAKFRDLLFTQEGLVNVTSVHANPSTLPFAPGSFDLAVLCDQLEWAACGEQPATAEAAQRALLAQVFRLLRPGAALCLGVRNRFSPGALLGRPNQGRPPRAGVLPRPFSRLCSWLCREPPCRPLTHSPAGYRRLLAAAGFTDIQIHIALPSHRRPQLLIPLEDGAKLGWAAQLSFARRAGRLGMGGRLAHRLAARPLVARLVSGWADSLIIWARRPGDRAPQESLPRGLRARVAAEWPRLCPGRPGPDPLSVVQLAGNWERGGKVNWFLFPGRSREAALVAKVARTPADAERIEHENEVLHRLHSLGEGIAAHVPRPLARWETNGHAVVLQEYTGWTPLRQKLGGLPPGESVAQALRVALPFLTALGARTRGATGPTPLLEGLLARALLAAESPQYPERVRLLFGGLARLAQGAQAAPFTVLHHGDLNVADFLVAPDGFRVLDWEWAAPRGLPFADVFGFALTAAALQGPGAVAAAALALARREEAGPPFGEAQRLARAYCRELGLDDGLRGPLAAAALLLGLLRTRDCRVSHAIISMPYEPEPMLVAGQAILR